MKNLVSRNPVQRFKQGRKIIFAKPGDKMLYNGNEEVTEEVLNGQTIYRRKNGTYVYPNNRLLSPIKQQTKEYIPIGGINEIRQKYLGKSNLDISKKKYS